MKDAIESVMSMGELDALARRSFLKGIGIAGFGAVGASLLAGCGGSGSPAASTSTSMDQQILGAAKIAEALAVTMYTSLIASPIFATLPGSDQAYFTAAMNEEMFHYNLLKSSTGNTDAPLTYYFPTGMFTTGAGVATTFSTIVTLEEAFIAAYMFGIQNLSTASLKLLAAQIMGVESEHRALAKTAANDLGLNSTTGLSGVAEPNSPPNNVVYERTFGLNTLNGIVAALTPFFNASAAATAGYTVSATFNPAYSPNGSNLAGNPPS